MTILFRQTQRESIHDTATIRDIPPEIFGEILYYFVSDGKRDLVSASLVCRAWYPVAQRLIVTKREFYDENLGIERLACGLQTRAIVGADLLSIAYIHLNVEEIGKESAMMIAPLVSHSLWSLNLYFEEIPSLDCVEVLEAFFSQCRRIKNLRLAFFDFGNDPSLMSQNIKDGFGRLRQLDLRSCPRSLDAFIKQIAIPTLRLFKLYSTCDDVENDDILNAVALNCQSLTSLDITAYIESFQGILKIVDGCRDLETFKLRGYFTRLELRLDEFKAIASLPRLKSLNLTNCSFGEGALSGLAGCRGLRRLALENVSRGLGNVLPAIGARLYSLDLLNCHPGTVPDILEHCLEYLDLEFGKEYQIEYDALAGECKRGLKRLAKLRMNGRCIWLGTEWEGYDVLVEESDEEFE